jgi:hypothetical protein
MSSVAKAVQSQAVATMVRAEGGRGKLENPLKGQREGQKHRGGRHATWSETPMRENGLCVSLPTNTAAEACLL